MEERRGKSAENEEHNEQLPYNCTATRFALSQVCILIGIFSTNESLREGAVPEGRDGREKGRALGLRKAERKEQREERDKQNREKRAEERR